MIRRSVSAAYLLRDGFTGQPMVSAAVGCELDGQLFRPMWKPGGYLVLTDLAPGGHTLLLQSRGYQPETVVFTVQPGTPVEEAVALKPGAGYPFQGAATRLELTLSGGAVSSQGAGIWLAAPARAELKLAQEQAGAGDREIRIFCRGPAALLPVPGPFLLSDGAKSEIVRLRSLTKDAALLAAPLEQPHPRGRALLPAQRFRVGPDGALRAVFHSPGRVEVLAGAEHRELELTEGENRLSLAL